MTLTWQNVNFTASGKERRKRRRKRERGEKDVNNKNIKGFWSNCDVDVLFTPYNKNIKCEKNADLIPTKGLI